MLREENRAAIAQNGFVIYIERDIFNLPTEGRPLSKDKNALQEMYKLRHPIYLSCADCRCINDSSIEDLAQDALKKFAERKI